MLTEKTEIPSPFVHPQSKIHQSILENKNEA